MDLMKKFLIRPQLVVALEIHQVSGTARNRRRSLLSGEYVEIHFVEIVIGLFFYRNIRIMPGRSKGLVRVRLGRPRRGESSPEGKSGLREGRPRGPRGER